MKLTVNNPTMASDVELEVFGLGVFKNDGKENVIVDKAILENYRTIYRQDAPSSLIIGGGTSVPVDTNEEEL